MDGISKTWRYFVDSGLDLLYIITWGAVHGVPGWDGELFCGFQLELIMIYASHIILPLSGDMKIALNTLYCTLIS